MKLFKISFDFEDNSTFRIKHGENINHYWNVYKHSQRSQ